VLCCDFSPDGTKLLTGDAEGSVKVHIHVHVHTYTTTCTCSAPSGIYYTVYGASFYLSIQIWSLTTKPGGRLLNDLALHVDWVNCVLYSPSGRHILSAGDNGIIKVHVHIKLITGDVCGLIRYVHVYMYIFGWFPDPVE
jgi:WD40 repeat protein